MSTEENKAIARRWFEESGNRHNLAIVDELFTPDYVNHALGAASGGGREGEKQLIAGMFTAFPDMRFTVEDMVAEGDKVAVRYTIQGTHQGPFMGLPATGKAFTTMAIVILRFENGKIAEEWFQGDDLGMMQQLGVIPAPGQTPS
jgi:steroid delta-isomerase-like uncharacterized protein